jgi:Phenol hydroxylase conserved region
MSVKAVGAYDFPAVDPPENYGGDLVFYTYDEGNTYFATAFTFRAPPQTPWGAFRSEMLDPLLSADPDIDLAKVRNWRVDDEPITPGGGDTLADLGIGWKSFIRFNS